MKLVAATKTKLYELTYLVTGSLTDSEVKQVQTVIQDLVKKHKGTIKSEEVWGKKSLAYAIRQTGTNHTDAIFLHLVVEFDTTQVNPFEKDVYLEDQVLRHLLVEAEVEVVPASKDKEEKTAEAK